MLLISLIVPFFNEESRLSRCIRSIQQQTLANYEVILIDDFSTDGSYALAEQLTQGDDHFRLLRNEQKGLYHARNQALSAACGEYICFLDADDYLLPGYLSGLYADSVTFDADLVVQGITHIQGSQHYDVTVSAPGSFDLTKDSQAAFSSFDVSALGNVVGKLFRRQLIADHHLSFSPHVYMCEDLYFTVSYLAVTHRLKLSFATQYQYIMHGQSMSAHYWSYPIERQSFDVLLRAWGSLLSVHHCPALQASYGSFFGTYLHRLVFSALTHPGCHHTRTQHLQEVSNTFHGLYLDFYRPYTTYTRFLKWAIVHHHYWLYLLLCRLAAFRYGILYRYI